VLDFVLGLHASVRYLVLIAAVLAIGAALLAKRPDRPASRSHAVMNSLFVGLLDLQIVIGLVLLVLRGFYPQLIGHVMMMILAAVVAHGFALAAKKRERERLQPAATLRVTGVVVAVVLIVGGILAIGRPVV
jgi:K+-transporting ATPase A subunit